MHGFETIRERGRRAGLHPGRERFRRSGQRELNHEQKN